MTKERNCSMCRWIKCEDQEFYRVIKDTGTSLETFVIPKIEECKLRKTFKKMNNLEKKKK